MSIDHNEIPFTTESSLLELDSTKFESEDFADGGSTQSSTTTSTTASQKRKRKLKAVNTWLHGRKHCPGEPERDEKNRLLWYCKHCSWSNPITTNVRKHMKEKHGVDIAESQSLAKKAGVSARRLRGRVGLQLKSRGRRRSRCFAKCCLAQLIVMRNLPHNAVKWPELQALLLSVNYCCEDALIDSQSTVSKVISKSFWLEMAALKQKLKTALSKIHLSVDCWSSPNRKNFQGICAHFVDESRVLRKALLALPHLPDGHGGIMCQAIELVKVLDEYEILDRIGYCTGDNHGSNDLMLRELSKISRSTTSNMILSNAGFDVTATL
jgi:hypothetical protein